MQIAIAEDTVNGLQEEIGKAFQSHHARVLRTAWRVTGSAMDAEDVLQTVFLRLLRRDESQPPPGNLEAYLHRAAVNAALDIVRARKDNVPVEAIPPIAPGGCGPSSPDSHDVQEFLRRSLAALTPQAAEIFTLRFLEGHSNGEIAKMLGISAVKVAVIVHRTRGKLQKEISRRFHRQGGSR